MVKKDLNRDARAAEDRRSTHDLRVDMDDRTLHNRMLRNVYAGCKPALGLKIGVIQWVVLRTHRQNRGIRILEFPPPRKERAGMGHPLSGSGKVRKIRGVAPGVNIPIMSAAMDMVTESRLVKGVGLVRSRTWLPCARRPI